jgi:RNA-directed DNA polymerase
VYAKEEGIEFLGFHFNGKWRRPRDKAKKKFKAEIKFRTRRQQPKNLKAVICPINPIIRGWGNYFKGGSVNIVFRDLDGYVRERLRCFQAKKRTRKVISFTLPKAELTKLGLITLSSLLNKPVSCECLTLH